MAGQARIPDARDRGLLREPTRDGQGRSALPLQPHREGLQAAQEIVGHLRVEHRAELGRDGPHARHQLAPARDRAAEVIAVAVEELGPRMHHQIDAHLDRPL